MKKLNYVIVAPRWNTGGAIALHALCKYLSDSGENAKIFYISRFIYRNGNHFRWWLHWFLFTIKDYILGTTSKIFGADRIKGYVHNSVHGCKRKVIPFFKDSTVVVYPEIIYGNPLNAKNVVRWLLYFYGKYYPEADSTWGENYKKDDLVFCYRKVFNEKKINPTERTLFVTYFDLELYKRTNFGDRNGKCYIIRKGSGRSDLPSSFDGVIIDSLSEKEKVQVFNECEYCISYDTQTAYSGIAALCGCISVVVPEEGKNREDYLPNGEIGYGRAYGFSENEIEYAVKTQNKVREYYIKLNEQSMESVKQFVIKCNEYFS